MEMAFWRGRPVPEPEADLRHAGSLPVVPHAPGRVALMAGMFSRPAPTSASLWLVCLIWALEP